MKSIKIKKFGGPEVLEIHDIEIGKPGPKPSAYSSIFSRLDALEGTKANKRKKADEAIEAILQ